MGRAFLACALSSLSPNLQTPPGPPLKACSSHLKNIFDLLTSSQYTTTALFPPNFKQKHSDDATITPLYPPTPPPTREMLPLPSPSPSLSRASSAPSLGGSVKELGGKGGEEAPKVPEMGTSGSPATPSN